MQPVADAALLAKFLEERVSAEASRVPRRGIADPASIRLSKLRDKSAEEVRARLRAAEG